MLFSCSPFFDHWGVPVSPEAKRSVAQWPGWMPSDIKSAMGPPPPIPARQQPPPVVADDSDDDHRVCVVCLERAKSTALVPCGHMCLCDSCASAKGLKKCPICRADVVSVLRVFH